MKGKKVGYSEIFFKEVNFYVYEYELLYFY